jgi:hypothetical protein
MGMHVDDLHWSPAHAKVGSFDAIVGPLSPVHDGGFLLFEKVGADHPLVSSSSDRFTL